MGIQTAESGTSKAKRAQKILSHLEIHPVLGSGHMVRHVYAGFGHEPKEVKFNKDGKSQGGEHIRDHVQKHAGLPEYSNKAANQQEERIESPSDGPED
jgi:hypothetical protein